MSSRARKLVLVSNILENKFFPKFLDQIALFHPGSDIFVTGDLLNIFPEPGEDMEGSMFYELYGDLLIREMDQLVEHKFRNVRTSELLNPLQEMFAPSGQNYQKALGIAQRRYRKIFSSYQEILEKNGQKLFFIPGNMDYPRIAHRELDSFPNIQMVDLDFLPGWGTFAAGIGGVPHIVHPFRGITEISPYEMHEGEFMRRLTLLQDARIVFAHVSPNEYPALQNWLETSSVEYFICRAAFNFNRENKGHACFRGSAHIEAMTQNKKVLHIAPFDERNYSYFFLEVDPAGMIRLSLDQFLWESTEKLAPLPQSTLHPDPSMVGLNYSFSNE